MTLSITINKRDTQHNDSLVMLSVSHMLSVKDTHFMLSVIVLSVGVPQF